MSVSDVSTLSRLTSGSIMDMVTGTGKQKKYVAILNDGQVVFTDASSKGNRFVSGRGSIMSGRKYMTT